MAEFVAPAIEVGKCAAEPIKRQHNYLCCFNTNIQNLRDEARRLDDAKEGLQRQVEMAKRNTENIFPEVETWLDNVDKIQENYISNIEPEILNVKSGCLAIKSRFSLSRKATKLTEAMKKLQDHEKFEQISIPAVPASMASIPVGQTCELESRKHIEEDIMTTLKEEKVSLIGICGMGGVGKTTMAKKIMNRAREKGLFDEIVMVVVSQPVDMFRIQKEMAELLGLKLIVESLPARAHLLRSRLMNSKSILIILDDLWEGLNLEDLGVPYPRELKESAILLTSRDTDVFNAMNVEKIFQIKILSEIEAWSLFKEKVGACADDQSLFSTAREIVRECKGLPIALVTVGVALKDKANKSIWHDALQEIRSYTPDIPEFLARVYNPLKLSYDLLDNKHAKLIFLLCCLFPEDHNILIYKLSLCAWGLGMFEGKRSLQVARNKVQTLVEMLKSRSLLLESRSLLLESGYEGVTKMHDVVRDVGIFIAAKEGLIDPNLSWKSWPSEENIYSIDCAWISLFGADKITPIIGSNFPNLHFLLIEGPHSGYRQTKELLLCDDIFESARKLHVLSIGYYKLESLPLTMQFLKNLRSLILYSCESLKDISIVGELVCLEILYCHECYSIEELTVEIGRLNQLKLLHIWECRFLETIEAGVISRLIRLEELTLIYSFKNWVSGGSGGKNAGLCELNSLSSLTTLKIQIDDVSLAAEQIQLSPTLVEFDITIGGRMHVIRCYGREMQLKLEREVIMGDWIHQLLRSTESLVLRGEGSSKLVPLLPEIQSLKRLNIYENVKMTRLSDGRSCGTTAVFPLLEFLTLCYIDDLEVIHSGPISSDSFKNLKEIALSSLPKLQRLGNYNLLRLKSLSIRSCSMLEQVVLWNEEEIRQNSRNHHRIAFPELKKLILYDLSSLTSFCNGSQRIEFPVLDEMVIMKCPNLKSLLSSTENDHNKCPGAMKHDDESLHLFCKSEAAFGRLKKLRVGGYKRSSIEISRLWCDQISVDFCTGLVDLSVHSCDNINNLFSLSIAKNLVNLESFEIRSCSMLEQVVLWNEDKNGQNSHHHCGITFPKLKKLGAYDLPKLASFCKGIQSIEFPLLTEMEIVKCPNMKSLVSSVENDLKKCSDDDSLHFFCKPDQVAFGRLEYLLIDGYESISSLWCDQIPIDFFTRLVNLTVRNCGNVNCLFSLSIVRNLVNLRELHIERCHEMVKVIEDKVDEVGRSPFINLKALTLKKLAKLKSLCDWSCAFELPSLEQMSISECPLMERFTLGILSSPISSVSFKNLERIEILSCSMLEQVMLWNEEENGKDNSGQSSRNHHRVTFQKLAELRLHDLSRLTSFCKGIQSIEFPLLTEMEIMKCPNLKSLVSSTENDKRCSGAINHDADDPLHFFCKSEAAFDGLRFLKIGENDSISGLWCDLIPMKLFNGLVNLSVKDCGNVKSLFSASVAENLINLTALRVESCCEMVKVIEDEEVEMSPFIKLKVLSLEKLPKLMTFCDWRCALQFPSLRRVHISECPEMERFSFGSLTTPCLKWIFKNGDCISDYTQDLNDALYGGDFLHLDILFGTHH